MYEKLNKCPLCESGHFSNMSVIKDHAVSKESFSICKCKTCGLIFTNPRPDEKNIQNYYQSPNYISHTNQTNNFIDFLYKLVRIYTTRQKLSWINKFHPKKGRLLDLGCGTGHFLSMAMKKNWKTIGIEPNEIARKQALLKHLDIRKDIDSIKNEKKFDVITLFHVLEHIHQLDPTIKDLLKALKKRGSLIIAFPNHDSHDRAHYEEKWASYDIPRHLYHFNKNSMEHLANKYSLTIREILPMKFDSYYISLLSDKYQGNTKNPTGAFLKGHRFNKMAKTDGNYSSLVFVLRKK